MSFGVKLKIWGSYACFTRPEMKVERVSYEVMTPSAARGVLEAIYWKPEITWCVDRIHVLNPIRFQNIRRNELESKIPSGSAIKALNCGEGNLGIFIEETRQQRAAMVLRDVSYLIEAHFELCSGEENPQKHKEIFERRARKGQCFHTPYLGTREFPAFFSLFDRDCPASQLKGSKDLGWMLRDIDFQNGNEPYFFHAFLENGILEVPKFDSAKVRR